MLSVTTSELKSTHPRGRFEIHLKTEEEKVIVIFFAWLYVSVAL